MTILAGEDQQSVQVESEAVSAEDRSWDLRWDLRHWTWSHIRYHKRRQLFFDRVDKLSKAFTLLLGASLLGEKVKAFLPLVASLISCLSLLALVFGYSDRKQTHKELGEAFGNLAAAIESVPPEMATPREVAKWASDYAQLCAKEPPALRSLMLICEKEQSTADNKEHKGITPGWVRTRLSHFL